MVINAKEALRGYLNANRIAPGKLNQQPISRKTICVRKWGIETMKIKHMKIKSTLYLGMLLLIIKTVFYYSTVVPYSRSLDNILQYGAVICFVYTIIKQKYSPKTLTIYALITLVTFYSCYKIGDWGMLISVITILAIRKENINKVIDFIYTYELLAVSTNILLSLLWPFGGHIISDYYGKTVLALGFVHRNVLSCFIFNLMILWMWRNYERINNKRTIANLLLLIFLLYVFIKTKTTALTMLVIVAMVVLFHNNRKPSTLLTIGTAAVIPSLSCLFYWFVNHYNNPITRFFDKVLTYRIQQNAYIFEKYGLSFWGQTITDLSVTWDEIWKLDGNLTFDCLYTYLFVNRGIVWVLIISIIFLLLSAKRNNKVNIFLLAWALYGIAETCGVNCFQCFPIILSVALFDNKFKEIEDCEDVVSL